LGSLRLRERIQVHAGIGSTDEHILRRYKRAQWPQAFEGYGRESRRRRRRNPRPN
jgi:hypothetical protein